MPASCRPSPASTCAAAIAAFIVAVGATAAPAQQAPESPPAAWRVECSGDGRQLLVSAAVRPAADGKSGAMVMTLPLGLNLTEQVLVKVDNGTPERQPIQTCTNVGCFVAMTLTDRLVAAMRTGSELKITVQDANKKPIDMSLPLLGFGIAFDKAK